MRDRPVFWLFILLLAGIAAFFIWQIFRPVNLPDVNMFAFAILFVLRADSLRQWRQILSPGGSGDAHIRKPHPPEICIKSQPKITKASGALGEARGGAAATFFSVLRIESTRSASER